MMQTTTKLKIWYRQPPDERWGYRQPPDNHQIKDRVQTTTRLKMVQTTTKFKGTDNHQI